MGMRVEGVWRDVPRDPKSTGSELCGRQFTEADVRLFATLVRFDAVHYPHPKCNLRRLTDSLVDFSS
jgi:glutathionyl-hydroquinone reductase